MLLNSCLFDFFLLICLFVIGASQSKPRSVEKRLFFLPHTTLEAEAFILDLLPIHLYSVKYKSPVYQYMLLNGSSKSFSQTL